MKFGDATKGAIAVVDNDVFDEHIFVYGVDTHFCFNFESIGEDWESFHEFVGEGTVASHDVFDVAMEKEIDETADGRIADVVEGTLIFFKIGGRKTIADNHVNVFVEDELGHFWGLGSRIGVVAVNHNVALGVDITKHAADDIAFALPILMPNDGSGIFGNFCCAVSGVIVVNVNCGVLEGVLKVVDDFFDCASFVVAWYEYGDFIFFHDAPFLLVK